MLQLEPFQVKFMAAATAPKTNLAALSLPRGNGKSRLAAYLVERILSPADPLFMPGTESVLCAASIEPCLSGLHPHPLGLEWAQTG